MYMSPCAYGRSLTPPSLYKPSNRKRPRYIYIYTATLCLSRGAVSYRLLCAFSLGDELAFAFSSGASQVLVKLISPPEGRGTFCLFGFFIFKVNRLVHFLSQGISRIYSAEAWKGWGPAVENAGFPRSL